MPKAMEQALGREADKKGYKGQKKNAFIYGTMRNKGKLKKKAKSPRAMQAEAVENY